jgi:hypothetical protein
MTVTDSNRESSMTAADEVALGVNPPEVQVKVPFAMNPSTGRLGDGSLSL